MKIFYIYCEATVQDTVCYIHNSSYNKIDPWMALSRQNPVPASDSRWLWVVCSPAWS